MLSLKATFRQETGKNIKMTNLLENIPEHLFRNTEAVTELWWRELITSWTVRFGTVTIVNWREKTQQEIKIENRDFKVPMTCHFHSHQTS